MQSLKSLSLSSNPLVQHSVLHISALPRYSTQLQYSASPIPMIPTRAVGMEEFVLY